MLRNLLTRLRSDERGYIDDFLPVLVAVPFLVFALLIVFFATGDDDQAASLQSFAETEYGIQITEDEAANLLDTDWGNKHEFGIRIDGVLHTIHYVETKDDGMALVEPDGKELPKK